MSAPPSANSVMENGKKAAKGQVNGKLPEFDIKALAILIADNDDHMRHTVTDVIHSFGVSSLHESEDGAEALKALGTFNPDIIIIEWMMPGVNGVELTQQIRRNERSPHRMTPIIILSAHTQAGYVMEARDAGATEYLAKPVTAKTLYTRICSVIEKPRAFIEAGGFTGPDRRRKHDPFMVGNARRKEDNIKPDGESGGAVSEDEINAMLGL